MKLGMYICTYAHMFARMSSSVEHTYISVTHNFAHVKVLPVILTLPP